jgi:hypothetical protein
MAIQDLLSQTDTNMILQRLCSQNTLTLYLFPSTPVQNSGEQTTISEIRPGDTLRLAIRFHHIMRMDTSPPFLRLQHSVPVLYHTSE